MTTNKINVLCVTDYYLPGFKGGGLIRTISNMCDAMSSDVDFWIFTRDRDLDSDTVYPCTQTNRWCWINGTHIYYANPDSFNFSGLTRAIETLTFDIVYLNSFFSYHASISICLKWRFSRTGNARLLVAPRGEFSEGALAIKKTKKRIYLIISRLLGTYKNIDWHASTEFEANDILRIFPGARNRIHLAADLVGISRDHFCKNTDNIKHDSDLRLVFISRISKKKNIDGLLNIILGVKINVSLTIFGPIEDESYWRRCQDLITQLPKNVRVYYSGELRPEEVTSVFAKFDIFTFPTHGENFGHVIFESLRAGTPVFVSDQTPWQNQPDGAITVIPLKSRDAWVYAIESAANRTADQRKKIRMATLEYARRYLENSGSLSANLEMFRKVASLES